MSKSNSVSGSSVADRRAPGPVDATFTRRAHTPISANTYDAGARTVEAVLSAGSTVRRYGFAEALEISAAAIDLARVEKGLCQLLDTHNAYELDAVLGRVTEARIEGDQLVGILAFADTEAGRAAEGMVARSELRGISIGYRVSKWEVEEGEADELDTWTATRWELLEVSLVPVPADADAGIRSLNNASPPSSTERKPAMPFSVRDGLAMMECVRSFGPQLENLARDLIGKIEDGETSPDAARAELLRACGEVQAARSAGIAAGGAAAFQGDESLENPSFFGRAAVDALAARLSGKPAEGAAAELRNVPLMNLCAEALQRAGMRDAHRMAPDALIRAASANNGRDWFGQRDIASQGLIGTGFLPGLLVQAGDRHLVATYNAVASPLKVLSNERSASSFRPISAMQATGFGRLRKVNENGEFENAMLGESAETYSVETFGRVVGLTRQAIVNDDLGAFSSMLTLLARAAAETEAELFADKFNSNPLMSDGNALFSDEHGNLAASGAVPSVTTLSAARLAMRSQRDTIDDVPINPVPKYIVIAPDLETTVDALMATITAATVGDVNPFAGKLAPIVDPRLESEAWYLVADPMSAPVLEHAYLNGESAPFLDTQEGFRVDGTEWKVRLDVGAGVVDWRGAYKNPGA